MKRKIVSIQFIENGLIILHNKEVKEYLLKSVDKYIIINKDLFLEELSNIIENNKINKNILTDNLNIIIDNSYSEYYLSNLNDIFKELSFNKIKYINIQDIINIQDDELLIDISTNSIKIITRTETLVNNIYFNKHKFILSIYLKELLKERRINTIYLYGNYPLNKKIIKETEKIICSKVYFYSQSKYIPIKLLI